VSHVSQHTRVTGTMSADSPVLIAKGGGKGAAGTTTTTAEGTSTTGGGTGSKLPKTGSNLPQQLVIAPACETGQLHH